MEMEKVENLFLGNGVCVLCDFSDFVMAVVFHSEIAVIF